MWRILTFDDEILINRFSQGIGTLDEMERWFEAHSDEEKRDIIFDLSGMTAQAHPTYEQIEEAASSLRMLTSSSAVKMLNKRKPFSKFYPELRRLPIPELKKTLAILLKIFAIADDSRKAQEIPGTCKHWWHRDLADGEFVEGLKRAYNERRIDEYIGEEDSRQNRENTQR